MRRWPGCASDKERISGNPQARKASEGCPFLLIAYFVNVFLIDRKRFQTIRYKNNEYKEEMSIEEKRDRNE